MKTHKLRDRHVVTAEVGSDEPREEAEQRWQKRALRLQTRRWQLLNQRLQTHDIDEQFRAPPGR